MTRLAPETPFSEQHAHLAACALPFPISITLPILKRCFHAFETALKEAERQRTRVDGNEICEIEDSCGCVCCDIGLGREMHEGQMGHWGYSAPGTLSFVPCTLPSAEVLGCSGEETRQ